MVHSDYYVTLPLFVVRFGKEMLTLATLNVLVNHHLYFAEVDLVSSILSGGSRIFPGGGGRQLPKLLLFFTFLPKTA